MSNFIYDVFISYSHNDLDWVKTWLLPRLEAANLRVCIDYRDFTIGLAALDNMADAAVKSNKTLFVMTPNWTLSEYSQFEVLVTQTIDPIGRKGRLLPLMLKDSDLPARLQIFTYANFKDPANWETELARVIATIGKPSIIDSDPVKLEPNLVHTYPLQANFTGRQSERDELTSWLGDDARPICAFIAIGGMGKSALSWYWLTRDVIPASKVEGVMWWSFFEGESGFVKFIDDALKYVTSRPIDAGRFPTTYDRAQELRRQLQTKRVLFVLDGFERQLRSYSSLGAAYQANDTTELSPEARACIDSIAARWLPDIGVGPTRAKVLLTSRLMVSELEDTAGDALSGVFKRELKELPSNDAVTFMRAQGVTKGTTAEIASVCNDYDNHPLSLRLLSGFIEHDKRMPGDIRAAPRAAARADFVAALQGILEQSYNALPEEESTLLSRIAAFRGAVTYDGLLIFNEFGDERRFDAALDDLQVRGLLQRDTANNRFDLHAVVRHYAYDRLADKPRVHTQLLEYFSTFPMPEENRIKSIEDLETVIELYHHTVRAGRYSEAVDLLYNQINDLLFYRFGAHQTLIELLRALFPDGEDQPPRLDNKGYQSWTMSALANSYSLSGQLRRSLPLLERKNAIRKDLGDDANLSSGLSDLALTQTSLGEFATAEQNVNSAISLCIKTENQFNEAVSRQILGRLLAYRGNFSEAENELDAGIRLHGDSLGGQWWQGTSWLLRAQNALLRHDIPRALEAVNTAKDFKNIDYPGVGKVERDIIEVEWVLGAALLLEGTDLNTSYTHLSEALTRCRRINLMESEPDILLNWARWYRARSNHSEAKGYAEEALAIADRYEYRLKQAEIHNFMAEWWFEEADRLRKSKDQKSVTGDLRAIAEAIKYAAQHAEIAKERAWCDGPPHCYKLALEDADAMLQRIGKERQ